jgi:hypothetical protein
MDRFDKNVDRLKTKDRLPAVLVVPSWGVEPLQVSIPSEQIM